MRLRSFYTLIIVFGWIPFSTAQNDVDESYESIEQLREQVSQYLYHHYSDELEQRSETDPNDLTVAVARLDPRLLLKRCDNPLTFELMDSGDLGGNVSVRTRCDNTVPWSIFVQAQVSYSLSVLVARTNLSRGAIVGLEDLEERALKPRDAGRDYITSPDQAVGKELRRPLQQGHAVRLAMLLEPKAIKRGDVVIIEAQSGPILVATPGVALSDGLVGDQIRVRNDRSQQEVKVNVIGPGRVRVAM